MNKNMSGDIIVYLRGGSYRFTSPLVLGASDSGTNGYSVIYRAYSGEAPIFSGGQTVTGWTLHDPAKNIYKANVGSRLFRQIYVAGQRAIRARAPNLEDPSTAGPYYTAISAGPVYEVHANEVANWTNLNQVEFVWLAHWMQRRARIASIEVSGPDATLTFMSPENESKLRDYFKQTITYYYVENAYELLDAPGEWYLNTSQQILYYKPRDGENMSTVDVITPVIESVVVIEGTPSSPVHNITLTGITFQDTNWTKPDKYGFLDGQAALQLGTDNNSLVPGAFIVSNANHIRLENNTFRHTGAHGLLMTGALDHNGVAGNTFTDLSAGGIYIYSDNSSYDLLSSNLVENVGRSYSDGVGILATEPNHLTIEHNEIRNTGYSGISIGWSWNDSNTGTEFNTVQYNKIHDVEQLHDDGAGVYSLGNQPNSSIQYNYVYSIRPSAYHGVYDGLPQPMWGIYLDNGSCGKLVQNNVLDGTNIAFFARNTPTHDNTFRNNYYNVPFGDIAKTNNVQNNTPVNGSSWPFEATRIMRGAGILPGQRVDP